MKKRTIAIFLSALMISSAAMVLSSCADKEGPAGSSNGVGGTQGPGGTDSPVVSGVPDGVNFAADGEPMPINFVVAEADAGAGDTFHLRSIKLDEDEMTENDKVDAAVAERNAAVEKKLGVEIVVYEYLNDADGGIRSSNVYTALSAQSDEYDVLCGLQWKDIDMELDGMLVDLNTLTDDSGNKVDYLSLNAPWWSGYYNESLRIGSNNSLYWVTGDLCLRYTGGYYCYFVNEKLYEQDLLNTQSDLLTAKNGEPTAYGPIYDLVARGDWTLDILSEMVAKAYKDDGDQKVNRTDVLGAALPIWDNTNGMAIAAGINWSEKTDNGVTLMMTSGNQRLIDFMSKMNTILKSGYVYNYGGDYQGAFTDFKGDLSCFLSGRLNQAELYLSTMTTNYHIIPCPKFDFDQDQYRSSVHDAINLYGVSYYSQNKVASVATLEEMAYHSYNTVRPIYYDQALKSMYTTDPGAARMIDLMHDVVYSDFLYIWQFSDYLGGVNGGGPNSMGDFMRNTVTSSKPASQIKKHLTKWNTGLDELLAAIQKLEEQG